MAVYFITYLCFVYVCLFVLKHRDYDDDDDDDDNLKKI